MQPCCLLLVSFPLHNANLPLFPLVFFIDAKMTSEISNIVPDIIKPFVDLVWFTHQAYLLLGLTNTSLFYGYLFGGLGLLHVLTPRFDSLVEARTQLEAYFR